jgi:hypothetical protein
MPAEKIEAADEKVRKYQVAIGTCTTAGYMVSCHDVPGLLNAIEKAETLGPIVDPTLYREKSGAMAEDAALLRAALPLWKLMRQRLEAGEKKASGG